MKKILLLIFVFFPFTVHGAFTVTEKFDTYTDGDSLNGKTGTAVTWSLGGGDVAGVTNSQSDTAPNSAFITLGGAIGSITTTTDGTLYYSVYITGDDTIFRLRTGATNVVYNRRNGGNLEYYDGSNYVSVGALSANTWHRIGIEFDNGGNPGKARYQIDNGTWSSYAPTANGGNSVDTIVILGTATEYIDTICPTYSCSGAGGGGGTVTNIDTGTIGLGVVFTNWVLYALYLPSICMFILIPTYILLINPFTSIMRKGLRR